MGMSRREERRGDASRRDGRREASDICSGVELCLPKEANWRVASIDGCGLFRFEAKLGSGRGEGGERRKGEGWSVSLSSSYCISLDI